MGMDSGQITGLVLADKLGIDPGTMRKRIERTFGDVRPAMSTPLSAEQVEKLSGTSRTKRTTRKSRTVRPVAPAPESTTPETPHTSPDRGGAEDPEKTTGLSFKWFLKAIVYLHAVLVLADLVILYAIPGLIAGLLVGFFMHSATTLAEMPNLQRTSGFAVFVCFVLDALAWFVHVPAFRDNISASVSDIVTQVLVAVVCAMSFAALYALRDSHIE